MPREMQDRTIDGVVYRVGYLSTSEALKTSALATKRLLPSIGKVLTGLGSLSDVKSIADVDMSTLKLDSAFPTLAESLDPEELTGMIQKLCSVVVANPEGILQAQVFEDYFKGQPGLALRVAAASFEVNCSDFFGAAVSGALQAMGSIQAKAK